MAGYQGQPAGQAPPGLPAGWGPAVVAPNTALLQACLAASAGGALTLLSPPWLTARFGPAYLLALAAPHRRPGLRVLVDAGDAPGHGLAALAAGADGIVLCRAHPAWAAVAAAAGPAALLAAAPPALDLGRFDPSRPASRARLDAWLLGA